MHKFFSIINKVLTILVVITITGQSVVQAQPPQQDGKPRIDYSDSTGKVVFIGADTNAPIIIRAAKAPGLSRSESALAMVSQYETDFGLRDAESELQFLSENQVGSRNVTRFQQVYQGIPVIAGEMVVNATDNAGLLSLSGEIAPNLDINPKPSITAQQATQTATEFMHKTYDLAAAEITFTTPELWIYDSRLLQPDGTAPALVWRIEAQANNNLAINEFILIDATRGHVALNFNQVDTAVLDRSTPNTTKQEVVLNAMKGNALQGTTWPIYFEVALDETRGWIYGSDSSGNKIDVISITTLQLVKSINLVAGASPKGIALSPDGSELAVAQSGAGSLLFINPDTNATVATIIPAGTHGLNKPWDVIYGRAGRLYSTGNPDSSGLDYIHIIDTSSHIEIGKSSHVIRSAPRLSISADKNSLFANEANFSPQKIYKYDVSTDIIPNPTSTPHTSVLSAAMFIVEPINGYIFTNTGQVWTSTLTAKIGSTGISGEGTYIPGRNAIAVASSNNNQIAFIDSNNFYTLSTFTLQGPMGAITAQSNGNKVFVSTVNGIAAIDLTTFPPGTPGTFPAGSLPYSDVVIDKIHGVMYGSDTTGHTIDVISLTTLQVVDEIRLTNGSNPKGMDLSPDGSELAVALSGANQIAFIDTNSLTVVASLIPDASDSPFDVKYGRLGRLYSTGEGGLERIHIIDTTNHTNVGKSSFIISSGPSLAISTDKNYLFAIERNIPDKLHKFNISTDIIPNPTSTQLTSNYTANSYILLADESKIFTSSGQVWSNPLDLSLSSQLGSFNGSGHLVEIQGQNLVAILESSGTIKFINTTNYSTLTTIVIPSVSSFGPSVYNSDNKKLYLNTNNGIKTVNLDVSAASFIAVESGSNQSAPLLTQFNQPLKAKVTNFLGQPIIGLNVTFTAPASGPSGMFGNSISATAITDTNGIATSPAFTSNNVFGAYQVQATFNQVNVLAVFSLLNGSIPVSTYTLGHTTAPLPGQFLCNSTNPNCTNGSNLDADAAHKYAIGTYIFYANHHNRQSINNQNMTMISSVDYGNNYQNAYWSGTQMVYGDGYPLADDVVAHELTHGVTQYESNLFYYYQSGAINESFSDVWGELYDQENGLGNDTTSAKWLMGEDLPIGAIRSMSNPPAYSDPDKMTSTYYHTTSSDNGGVHTNSGINNKAVYLMVDGGTFNGKTVTALGANKTLAIYYEVQTNLLSSGADYGDLYNLLYQACLNLVNGPDGITNANCQEVRDATDAVEMNLQPIANFNTDAPLCAPSQYVVTAYQEGFESGLGSWTINNGATPRWQLDSPYGAFAHSGSHFLYGNDYPQQTGAVTDATARWSSKLIPAGAYLHFAHAYDFETNLSGTNNYDGGVLEYSTNGGSTWLDAGSLIDHNGYKGSIYSAYINPLKGRSAFVGTSHGYISTRVNLASLAGQNVSFRWRMGLDDSVAFWGWWIDDVQIYTCSNGPTISGSTGISGVMLSYTDVTSKSATSDGSGNYSLSVTNNWSGTLTPSHACYSFTPSNIAFSNVQANQSNQNFTPTLLTNKVCILTIARSGASPTNAASVDFTVTFTTGVTGVDVSDFTLTTTGVTGASVTSVTPVSASVYTVSVSTGSGNGTIRLDVPNTATISDLSSNALSGLPFTNGEVYAISKMPTSATFGDVPMNHPYWADIEILYANGFTGGCSASPLLFCPETTMDRAQGAVFMLRGLVGTSYVPPSAPYSPAFGDSWSPGPWAQPWAQGMLQQGLTAGCSTSPLLYCPWEQMPRSQAAVFGMRLLNSSSYLPPAGTGTVFADVNGSEWYAGWAEQAYLNGLLPACGMQGSRPLFCPNSLVSRGLGAYMIVRARNLSMP